MKNNRVHTPAGTRASYTKATRRFHIHAHRKPGSKLMKRYRREQWNKWIKSGGCLA